MPAWKRQNPKTHELSSLALFAMGNYPAAASEAHAAMALGPPAEWNDLYAYYNDVTSTSTQLCVWRRRRRPIPNRRRSLSSWGITI